MPRSIFFRVRVGCVSCDKAKYRIGWYGIKLFKHCLWFSYDPVESLSMVAHVLDLLFRGNAVCSDPITIGTELKIVTRQACKHLQKPAWNFYLILDR